VRHEARAENRTHRQVVRHPLAKYLWVGKWKLRGGGDDGTQAVEGLAATVEGLLARSMYVYLQRSLPPLATAPHGRMESQ
jgi:hypothetical protein